MKNLAKIVFASGVTLCLYYSCTKSAEHPTVKPASVSLSNHQLLSGSLMPIDSLATAKTINLFRVC